jgi:hypothetical protein
VVKESFLIARLKVKDRGKVQGTSCKLKDGEGEGPWIAAFIFLTSLIPNPIPTFKSSFSPLSPCGRGL